MDIREYLAQVIAEVRANGGNFVSPKDAKSLKVESTADKAFWAIKGDKQPSYDTEDFTLAGEILDWVRESNSGSGFFLKSVRPACQADDIGYTQAERVAYALPYFLKVAEDSQSEVPVYGENSNFVGEPGEEIAFLGTVAEVREFPRFNKQVVNLLSDGNVFTVWRSLNYKFSVASGDSVRCIGIVKKHDEYKGRKQTILTGNRGRGGGVKIVKV